jgi:hypothetical protein
VESDFLGALTSEQPPFVNGASSVGTGKKVHR